MKCDVVGYVNDVRCELGVYDVLCDWSMCMQCNLIGV